ncbi:MAG: 1,4-alpha-glucan branching protein GlgB [Pseudoramibacter sp. EUB1.1]|uniref:1,4-alpha-glucan branching enzyme n=1 Tax=Candidatus Pseudoramibacter fermentans TaxID=2594427 RepID=A0A6L5GT15_9FIRM|nr:1,4-alpha-glucan branching protein GlgB [Candidatus Pseudoramibacter fermentans]
MDFYQFYTGHCFDAHKFLGAHLTADGAVFRTFAPAADKIDLRLWQEDGEKTVPMHEIYDGNFYECEIAGAAPGDYYAYEIYHNGGCVEHCDPYGFGMELRPGHRSVIRDLGAYTFKDQKWMDGRDDGVSKPENIYEMHLGSWRKKGDAPDGDWYTYEEIAGPLIAYLVQSGYNAVEFLPLSEHPADVSWGYQNTGFFASTSRYGDAAGLMALVDELHQHDIAVIMDFVPVHFAVDDYGLANYDGTPLYEYPNQDVGNSEWGSKNFIHSRGEVCSFLQSAANYWLETYHFDGLRMDAISRIIYWQGDEARGVNYNAVDFIKTMNKGLKARHPSCVLMAEDSTNFEKVTAPVDEGGLGFDYKWDLGWMHDTLSFFQSSPEQRLGRYHKLTFSMMYYYNEHYLLPYSHDEVVHGKATILQKMNGDYDGKFPQARAMYAYMIAHPGKKLNFMGNEIGHFREWDEKREQDWNLLEFPIHEAFYHYICDLNHLYLNHPALYAKDYDRDGFEWTQVHGEDRTVYGFERRGGGETILALFNFSDKGHSEVLPGTLADYELLIHSNDEKYGGTVENPKHCLSVQNGKVVCALAPFSGILFLKKNK